VAHEDELLIHLRTLRPFEEDSLLTSLREALEEAR
jgi:hypothetical protein